jgi:hypothetical protein
MEFANRSVSRFLDLQLEGSDRLHHFRLTLRILSRSFALLHNVVHGFQFAREMLERDAFYIALFRWPPSAKTPLGMGP